MAAAMSEAGRCDKTKGGIMVCNVRRPSGKETSHPLDNVLLD